MTLWLLSLALVGAVMSVPTPRHRVTVKADQHTDFRAIHSYAWTPGWASFDRVLDRHIVEAVDTALAALGLTKRTETASDVIVTYGALRRTDVDLHAAPSPHSRTCPEYPVGTLVVLMMEPASRREVFRARVDVPLETDTAKLEQQIDTIVAQMFAEYPTRR